MDINSNNMKINVFAFQTKMWYSNLGKLGTNTENHLKNGCFYLVK